MKIVSVRKIETTNITILIKVIHHTQHLNFILNELTVYFVIGIFVDLLIDHHTENLDIGSFQDKEFKIEKTLEFKN